MILNFLIAIASIIGLFTLHELGHFVLAKRFGIRVDEFGIGYPPRVFGKKFGETVYSLNLLPFGAFVKIYGEEERKDEDNSFNNKPFWQKSAVILGGVVSFWIFSWVLLSIVFTLGTASAITDEETGNLTNVSVQIIGLAPDSPGEMAGLKPGDVVRQMKFQDETIEIATTKDISDFTDLHLGQEITLSVERVAEKIDITLVPRQTPPEGEGHIGLELVRTATKSYPFPSSIAVGAKATWNLTIAALKGWGSIVSSLFRGDGMPHGVQLSGPVGIFDILAKAQKAGVSYYLQIIAVISIFVALFNALPIPAMDGGKFLFICIEKLRRKPMNQKIEQNINAFSFGALVILAVIVTIKDIIKLF